jgi:formate dehydrogenase iron-sulfur subunit
MATTKIKEEMVKLIDLSKCTGCRGCQVACKNWNSQPGAQTTNWGSHQNPPDLQHNTWTLIRFQEREKEDGGVEWIFRKDGCFHCTDASCVRVCPSGALTYGEKGAVRLNRDLCIGCKYCVIACPFGIPRYDSETKVTYKCTLCEDRITSGMIPACVKACPTGCLSFGLKEQMIEKGEQRVAQLVEKGLAASLYGKDYVDGTHVMYVLTEQEKVYAKLPVSPHVPVTVKLWRNIAKPLGLLAIGGVIGGALLHYMIKGPKHPKEEGGK